MGFRQLCYLLLYPIYVQEHRNCISIHPICSSWYRVGLRSHLIFFIVSISIFMVCKLYQISIWWNSKLLMRLNMWNQIKNLYEEYQEIVLWVWEINQSRSILFNDKCVNYMNFSIPLVTFLHFPRFLTLKFLISLLLPMDPKWLLKELAPFTKFEFWCSDKGILDTGCCMRTWEISNLRALRCRLSWLSHWQEIYNIIICIPWREPYILEK